MSLEEYANTITTIGITDWRNKNQKFGIRDSDRLRHIYAIGKTGSGKSTLLQNMAIADIQNGKGVCIIDPHGTLAESILQYVPKERIKETIYFNATDTSFAISFNPLANVRPDDRHLVVSGIITTLKKIWGDSWGNRMEHILRYSLLALVEYPAATLLDISRILTNKHFRELVLHTVKDPYVLSFWYDEFARYPHAFRQEAISPVLNKMSIFSANSMVRNILSPQHTSLCLKQVIDSGSILICNLGKGKIGEDASSILGSMLINGLQLAVQQRERAIMGTLKPYFLYVDEMQSFVSKSFISILSEMRKFGLGVFLTHQYLDQIDEDIRASIFGNVGTLISFGVGNEDAEVLAKEFAPVFRSGDIMSLPRYRMYLKLMIDGATSKPFSAISLPLPIPTISSVSEVIANTRKTYCTEIKQLENRLYLEIPNPTTQQGTLF